ncbi:LIM domain only protein 7b [Trichomycterus rosablanca]|uniref:LIM domain only protein 7b n=1 Tax=Trichomycterus rosablanca TaxID=2290929 RepID=UPI002F353F89
MEWREQPAVGCEVAFSEAQKWIEEVTKKKFGSSNFRSALENGVLLCDLINKLKPGIIKRVNRLSTPIAGLDNVNVFLKACGKLGLNDAQLFHPGDLQDVSTRVTVRHEETSRRLKNVLITIYWLGRKAQTDPFCTGPQLNFKAFEGLLGVALSKALEEASCSKSSVRDSEFGEAWYPEREGPTYKREDSVESLDSVESRTLSVASDCTLIAGSEGFGSDAEAEHCFKMSERNGNERTTASVKERRNVPAAQRRKRTDQCEEGRSRANPVSSENRRDLNEPCLELPPASAFHQWAHDYQSDSESDSDRPEPDPVQDDLASRRFRATSCATPANFAVPLNPRNPSHFPTVTPSARRSWITMSDASRLATVPQNMSSQSTSLLPSSINSQDTCDKTAVQEELLLEAWNEESSDSDGGWNSADPIQDDLYSRRVHQATHQTSMNSDSDKFLPKYWTPEEDAHVGRIKLGSQRRPWYKKLQGFRSKSTSDLILELAPKQIESSTSYNPPCSRQGQQRKAGKILLRTSALEKLQPEQIQHKQARLKALETKWQEDLNKWKSRRRSTNLDLHRKLEDRGQLELITSWPGQHKEVQQESEQVEFPMFAAHVQSQARPQEPFSTTAPSSRALAPSQLYIQQKEHQLAPLDSEKAFAPSSRCSMPPPMSSAGSGSAFGSLPVNEAYSLANGPIKQGHYIPDALTLMHQSQEGTVVFIGEPGASDLVQTSSTTRTASGSEISRSTPIPVTRAKSLDGGLSDAMQMPAVLPRDFRRSEATSRLSTGVTPRPFGAKRSKTSFLPRFFSKDDSQNSFVKGQLQQPASYTCQHEGTTLDDEAHAHTNTYLAVQCEEGGGQKDCAPNIHSFMSASVISRPPKHTTPHGMSITEVDKVDYNVLRVSLNQKANCGRDFGFQSHWDSTGAYIKSVIPGTPAQLCNLQVGDEVVELGGHCVAKMSYEQWKAKMDAALREGKLLMDIRRHGLNGDLEHSATVSNSSSVPVEKQVRAPVNSHPVNGLPIKATRKSCEDSTIQTKSKGGSDSAISDLQVPSIRASSRWSWDTNEERRKQEKWQMEQERLLQEKYRRDQERLEEEWRRAQQEVARDELSSPEEFKLLSLSNENTTCHTSSAFPSQFTFQPLVAPSDFRPAADVEPARSGRVQIAEEHQTREEQDSSMKNDQWPSESYGFTKLTPLDRKKSKSTPTLDGSHKQEPKEVAVSIKKKGLLSQAEQERQHILHEMKKKTQFLTDNSWIRQQGSCTTHKEPVNMAPIRRYDSLDNLHTSNSVSKQFSSPSQPAQCNLASSVTLPYRGFSGRCSLGPNAVIFSTSLQQSSRPTSIFPSTKISTAAFETSSSSQQHSKQVSNRRLCSRCSQPLLKGAAVMIESLELSYHVGCFKCVSCRSVLGKGSEHGAQVRVRHKQLFCDTCYDRLRVRSGIPK